MAPPTLRLDLTRNPFFVLELPRTASALDVVNQGRKLMALLELGSAKAKSYATPLGRAPRDVDDVRRAMAELADPTKRALYARFVPERFVVPETTERAQPPRAYPEVWRALWWADDEAEGEGAGPAAARVEESAP